VLQTNENFICVSFLLWEILSHVRAHTHVHTLPLSQLPTSPPHPDTISPHV